MKVLVDFVEMPFLYAMIVYPITFIAVLGTIMYVGTFFCFTPCEKFYHEIKRMSYDDRACTHGTFIANMIASPLLWAAWFSSVEILVVLCGALSFFVWAWSLVWLLIVSFCENGLITGTLQKLHNKIHERKYGR